MNETAGQKWGRLTAVRHVSGGRWLCVCDCGAETLATPWAMRSGKKRSCGCLRSDVVRARRTSHGHTAGGKNSATYRTWRSMINRCLNPGNENYAYYGGRGISICDEWRSFDGFLEDMGERPIDTCLDRRDPNGDYRKANCWWQPLSERNGNKRNTMGPETASLVIDDLRAGATPKSIAAARGLSLGAIKKIAAGKSWAALNQKG
jgi:hypothetical protein